MEVFMRKFTFAFFGIAALLISTFTIATVTQPTASAATCVDITKMENLNISFPDKTGTPNKVHIETKQDLPVCKDTTVWFSSYILPQNYDNSGGFGYDYPTSYPQKAASHTRIDVKAGAKLNSDYTVPAVDLCKSAAQYDIYQRSQQIDDIKTAKGIFEYSDVTWAKGNVVIRDLSNRCNETPVTPETPSTPTPQPPVELPKTGVETPLAIAVLLGTLAYGVVYFVRRG